MLRVVAIEKALPDTGTKPVKAAVYKNGKLYVVDGRELYFCKEYFASFPDLEFYVKKGKFEWSDLSIQQGDLIARDSGGYILVNDDPWVGFSYCFPKGRLSTVSLRLFAEFLKSSRKNSPQAVKDISDAYASGSFREQIIQCIRGNKSLLLKNDLDKRIALFSRLFGKDFIIEDIRKLMKSDENHKVERATFFFTRLFLLEYAGYLYLDSSGEKS